MEAYETPYHKKEKKVDVGSYFGCLGESSGRD
jgi:hypothetical protein